MSALVGCGGGSDQSGGGTVSGSKVYKVTYAEAIDVSESAGEEFNILVEVANSGSSLTSASKSSGVTYSIETVSNANIEITNNCQNVAIGKPCVLMASLKKAAADTEEFHFVIKLSDGVSRPESAIFKKQRLDVNLDPEVALLSDHNNYISVTNTNNVAAYFDKPYFTDTDNKQIDTVLITDNTCTNELDPGQNCHFLIKGENGVVGQLKLDLQREPLASVSFSNVAVTATKTLDIPADAAVGVSYRFTYTFTNTNTTWAATGVSFTNDFAMPDFTIDKENSSCSGITSIVANSSCTWKGTFTPGSEGNKSMASILHYAEGGDVSLTSSSQATTVAVIGTKTQDIPVDAAIGVSYPFTYTFTNTNTTLVATGVSFTNYFFSTPDFTIDKENSSCNGITSIAANSSCTWKGTLTPGSKGTKSIGLSLHYAEGGDVYLGSSSWALLATAPINLAPNATENGWAWPAPRFESAKKADNSPCDDALYDKLTGLMWAKDGNAAGMKNWNDAISYANNLTLCGYTDWRLPTINELVSLLNYSDTVSLGNWLNVNGFSNIQTGSRWIDSSAYWSSTVDSFGGGGGRVWSVVMYSGIVGSYHQSSDFYVLPVRRAN
ncbi:DUF1566 domain-containing protein [Cysteiniphilum sp. QT6929]|uniref:Lcl C-terminal domain-containing protein n=1 Tax=Cysteiniphilum sp. QT6929 TaxID=2975055 RepID=UPI0024B35E65|nr:DUF1566 domain-containing protein [Cysteiniphilum sp. QT6929]WHN65087.1 DUF1566 domain-containing protein [Cysteiniphilum sp. QT6929]